MSGMIRVVHEVEQVVEPAADIGHSPTVKLGLHLRYPLAGPRSGPADGAPPFGGASFGIAASVPSRYRCRPSPCDRLSRPRSTTAAPPRPGPVSRRWTQPRHHRRTRSAGQGPGRFPCSLWFARCRLCPCGIAASTPQTFPTASRAALEYRPRSSPDHPKERPGYAPRPAQIHQIRAGVALRDVKNAGSSRTPLHHARRTRTIWQYWHVPALSGLLPALSGTTRIRLPSASTALLRQGCWRRSLTSTRTNSASRRNQDPRQSLSLCT